MKVEKPLQNFDLPKEEEKVLHHWKKVRAFQRSVEERPASNPFSFYDGPPFATGLPHHGHLLAGTIKDVIPRYWTMRGFRVERRFGWDCHGLPVEFEIEKTLNLKGRKDILEYGVDRFNEACRGIVLRYTNEWKQTIERLGRWIDVENDYKTMDLPFMESVWFVFHRLWEQGLIYEDQKVLPYSTRIATPLSNFEANLNYQDTQDPSVRVKFRSKDNPNHYFLIWTTTPWTLPANVALAVHPEFTYVTIRRKNEIEEITLEEGLAKKLFPKKDEYEILKREKGAQLEGVRYEQIIPAFEGKMPTQAHQILLGTFVTNDSGTGIVHMAAAFGEDDFEVCKKYEIPPMDHLDEDGVMTSACPLFEGLYFKDADKKIIQYLKEKGLLQHHETISHSYPFCYRSDTPLIYRAISTWFVRVTKIKDALIENNQKIRWVPDHLRDGRFGKWLENVRDWAISRNRFWGNPLPIWRNDETGETLCIKSREELEKLSGQKVDDLHKHFVDSIRVRSPKTGDLLTRIPHVLDCWFESGSMPYAQQHYPFSMDDVELSKIFPADFIAEGLDQTRGWFYTLLVLSTALGKGPAFRNVVVNGIVLAEDGRKMSKRLKNYPDPETVFHTYGADTLRIYLLQSGAVRGEDLRFTEDGLKEMTRRVLLPFWNAYSFFATYASVDGWDPTKSYTHDRAHLLDRWISIRLEHLKKEIEKEMEVFQLSRTIPPLLQFIDDLTNWYIRRSRRRFWKTENDQDKNEAYSTLFQVLTDFTKLAAPFIPFLTESIYQKLCLGHSLANKDSVHLEEYPRPRILSKEEKMLEEAMELTRASVSLGRELREKLKIRIRQPLQKMYVGLIHADHHLQLESMIPILKEELNVKEVEFLPFKEMATWKVKPNFRLLGKILGPKMREFQSQCSELRDDQVFMLLDGQSLQILGESFDRSAFEIELLALDSFVHPCHAQGQVVVALDTTLTEPLHREGLARELINRVQRLRKEAGFNVEDRIRLRILANQEMQSAFETHRDLIESETLSSFAFEKPPQDFTQSEEEIEGSKVQLGVAR